MKIRSFRISIARKKSKNSVNCNVNWNWMRRTAECCNSNWGRPRDRRNRWKLRGIRQRPKWKSCLEKGRRPMIRAPKRRMQRYGNSKPNSGSLKRWVLLWQFLIERRDLWKIYLLLFFVNTLLSQSWPNFPRNHYIAIIDVFLRNLSLILTVIISGIRPSSQWARTERREALQAGRWGVLLEREDQGTADPEQMERSQE